MAWCSNSSPVLVERSIGRFQGESGGPTSYEASWREVGPPGSKGLKPLIVLDGPGLPGRSQVVGFDMDSTIITTKSGRTFPTGPSDWKFLYNQESTLTCRNVPDRLRELHKAGSKVVIFTNQGGIEKGKQDVKGLLQKIEDIICALCIPVQVFISTGESEYRKPSTGMWDYMEREANQGVVVDRNSCTYVGDAAGRAKDWAPGKPKDFNCSDRKFAANLGVKFFTPEEFFLGEAPAPFEWRTFDPKHFLSNHPAGKGTTEYHSKKQEMVVMVALPAGGKSTFCKCHLVAHGYTAINRDTLKTQAKCQQVSKDALKSGKSVVIDNTNSSKAARAEYITIAKKAGVPVRCFHLVTPFDLAHHLNYFRQTQTKGTVRRIPDVAYNVFKKNFEEPTTAEGFTEVKTIEFQAHFDRKADEDLFKCWT
ncbi:bifunctional polynucleotide phosphatase/kinase-like [Branchiostoma floridae]|uniref:Bifunctional polynucleotide phosphatase/kinase-like n=1 Tax=Branchiostoma floridae TaxID=7739 RepID=A0A9J7MD42_BRAFL|nr:bifunctional polynucleotide phosphatase/kinase-like [Branchiostoma floridae]